MATSEWIQFFEEAGIPPGPAVSYAVMFVDNRIQKNMLMDLNKEIMNELGITVVGDIIAILKHAKIVYRQEMCKAATELLQPGSPPSVPAELRRSAGTAASRMIANSLSRESPPATPPLRPRPRAPKISITVANKPAATKAGFCAEGDENPTTPVKRRRVTAEMEGKYIINMPKGTTPRTRKILEQQAAKGLQRTSVFDRLGAEANAEPSPGGKPTGVFSRLGDASGTDGDKGTESGDDEEEEEEDGASAALPYAGVLKKPPKPPRRAEAAAVKAKATSSEAKPVPVATAIRRLARGSAAGSRPAPKRRQTAAAAAQDGDVSSTRGKGEFRVTIRRTWGCGAVSSTSEGPGAQMDHAGAVSVFKRLGKKPD